MNGTRDFAIMNQGMGLHVFFALKVHVAILTLDPGRAFATNFTQVVPERRLALVGFATIVAGDLIAF